MPTAEAARKRLIDLGTRDPTADPEVARVAQADLKALRNDLKAWTVRQRPWQPLLERHVCAPC